MGDNQGPGVAARPVFKKMKRRKRDPAIFFEYAGQQKKPYPAWRYHKFFEPRVVNDTAEDEIAEREGWDTPDVPITAVSHFANWYHDLEDMNSKQLCLFAKEEYGVELPDEASEEKLLKAIWNLAQMAPQNQNRMILFAQSCQMNYDETVLEIRRRAEDWEEEGRTEFWA